jgi:uncharacterized membrane protein
VSLSCTTNINFHNSFHVDDCRRAALAVFLVCLAFCFVYLLYCFIPAQHDTLLIIFVPFYCVLAVARGRWLQNMLHLIQLGLTICVTII